VVGAVATAVLPVEAAAIDDAVVVISTGSRISVYVYASRCCGVVVVTPKKNNHMRLLQKFCFWKSRCCLSLFIQQSDWWIGDIYIAMVLLLLLWEVGITVLTPGLID
jgi:hypothetical protein